ncbi:ATP-binding protein [Streptomyces mirabilis]|uniref:ATP-binding protein n=1 Tax=Streptomyces mirabilis TaxID=68239 RepID=UPI0032564266
MLGLRTGDPRDPHRAPPRPSVAAGSRAVALWLAATLGLGTEDDHRVIEVTDDGPGVPDALRARIFDRFVRGEGASAGGGGSTGSGLGLSIVAAIAAAHGGTVTLEPSDRGAWFRVRLPAGP